MWYCVMVTFFFLRVICQSCMRQIYNSLYPAYFYFTEKIIKANIIGKILCNVHKRYTYMYIWQYMYFAYAILKNLEFTFLLVPKFDINVLRNNNFLLEKCNHSERMFRPLWSSEWCIVQMIRWCMRIKIYIT
jgi:hypothetical protein